MNQAWIALMLASFALLAAVAGVTLVRARPRGPELSPEELADLADAPAPTLEKGAWLGLAIGLGALGTIAALLMARGTLAYSENDQFRLLVLGIFMAGLVGSALSTNIPVLGTRTGQTLDERDRAVLARAPVAQGLMMILGLVSWVIVLSERFHDEGAVPVVYLNLIFGSVVLLMMIGQAVGILLGYRFQAFNAEG